MALGHISVNIDITDIDTSTGSEADSILVYWDEALGYMLEDKKPGWAENFVNLSVVAENPNALWDYSYRYPSDCQVSIGIVDTGAAGVSDRGEIPYRPGSDNSGRLIYTDEGPTAVLHYIRRQNDTDGWRLEDMPSAWALALSYLLASFSAGALAKNGAVASQMLQKYELYAGRAAMSTQNEMGIGPRPESAAARARR